MSGGTCLTLGRGGACLTGAGRSGLMGQGAGLFVEARGLVYWRFT